MHPSNSNSSNQQYVKLDAFVETSIVFCIECLSAIIPSYFAAKDRIKSESSSINAIMNV